MPVTVEATAVDQLGEGPVWLAERRRLLRVDIHAPAIVLRKLGGGERCEAVDGRAAGGGERSDAIGGGERSDAGGGEWSAAGGGEQSAAGGGEQSEAIGGGERSDTGDGERSDTAGGGERRYRVDAQVGFALPCRDGGFVAGVGRELVRFAELGGAPERLAAVEPDRRDNRFNDAVCDPAGRLWAGTMSTTREPGVAALYRLEPGGAPEVAIAGATISNGLDFNGDATQLYYIDSTTQWIDAITFDVDRGRLGARRPLIAIDPADGLPDGLCVDADGGIWVALFGGGAIRRYRPDGTLDEHIPLPVTNPTCLAFAGDDLTDLYVTSARHRLTPEQLAREPLAGSLLRLRPGVRGRLPNRFAG